MAVAELSWVRLNRPIRYHRMVRHGAGPAFVSESATSRVGGAVDFIGAVAASRKHRCLATHSRGA